MSLIRICVLAIISSNCAEHRRASAREAARSSSSPSLSSVDAQIPASGHDVVNTKTITEMNPNIRSATFAITDHKSNLRVPVATDPYRGARLDVELYRDLIRTATRQISW